MRKVLVWAEDGKRLRRKGKERGGEGNRGSRRGGAGRRGKEIIYINQIEKETELRLECTQYLDSTQISEFGYS